MRSSGSSGSLLGSIKPVSMRNYRNQNLQHRLRRQQFHATPVRPVRHKSPYRSISQAEMERIDAARKSLHSKLTNKELKELKTKYTPEQFTSITAAEEAVDIGDLSRAKPRQDVLRPKEMDAKAYARIQPVIDKRIERIRGEWDNTGDNDKYRHRKALPDADKKMKRLLNIMVEPSYNPHDAVDNRIRAIEDANKNDQPIPPPADEPATQDLLGKLWRNVKIPEEMRERTPPGNNGNDPNALDSEISRIGRDLKDLPLRRLPKRSTRERLEAVINWRTHKSPEVAPEIPMIRDPKVKWATDAEEAASKDLPGMSDESIEAYAHLARTLGEPIKQIRGYRVKQLNEEYVSNQTRLGKVQSQRTLTVAGDGKGMVGIGVGKAVNSMAAKRAANMNAIRNMRPIARYESRTIFGESTSKCGAVRVTLSSRPPGHGLRVQGLIFEIAKAAGIYDLGAKVHGSRNKMNVIKATWQALIDQKNPDDIARARGKKLIDVRKVYNAGL